MARSRRTPGTPEGKAAKLQEQKKAVTRKYKTNVTRRRKFNFEGEEELVIDMIIFLKIANYSNTQIAMIVGVSKGQVAKYLDDGNVQKRYISLKAKLPEAAFALGQAYLIEAVQAVANVMRTTDDDSVVLKAAGEIFDRFGIPKVSRTEMKNPEESGDEHPVDKTLMDRIRAASPEVQQGVAELQEMFETGIEQLLAGGNDGPA